MQIIIKFTKQSLYPSAIAFSYFQISSYPLGRTTVKFIFDENLIQKFSIEMLLQLIQYIYGIMNDQVIESVTKIELFVNIQIQNDIP